MPEQTEQTQQPPAPYKLSEKECAILQQVKSGEVQVKARIFDLNAQLEGAQKDLLAVQAQYHAVVGTLAASQGWDKAEPSPDFTALINKG